MQSGRPEEEITREERVDETSICGRRNGRLYDVDCIFKRKQYFSEGFWPHFFTLRSFVQHVAACWKKISTKTNEKETRFRLSIGRWP